MKIPLFCTYFIGILLEPAFQIVMIALPKQINQTGLELAKFGEMAQQLAQQMAQQAGIHSL